MRDVERPQVFLRIFSGAQAGAEAGFPPGTFVIGTDDSCDIIFAHSGLESRHIELTVKPPLLHLDGNREAEDDDSASSFMPPTVTNLDGDVRVNNQVLASGSPLMPGVPLFMGAICVALARPDTLAADWNAVRDALQALDAPQAAQDGGQGTSPQPVAEVIKPATLEAPDTNTVGNTLPSISIHTLPAQNNRKRNVFMMLVVAVALSLLIFRCTPNTDSQQQLEAIRQNLAENGFAHIDVRLEKQDVILKGVLRNDDERARLLSLARNMQHPVHLDISIRQDRKNAIEAAFAGRGFQLEVTDDPDENTLLVAGYMQDKLVEEWAFSSSRDDVPNFESGSAGVVRRRIRYAEDVAAILEPALNSANLNAVSVTYRPGHVELQADLDGEQKLRLQEVLSAVQEQLEVPLAIRLFTAKQSLPEAQASNPEKNAPAAPPPMVPTSFRVVEVVMSPIPFVRLATGERVFEGGLMPGNVILARITLHELTLTKGDTESIYKLRGAQ